jgi:hypothetical protein
MPCSRNLLVFTIAAAIGLGTAIGAEKKKGKSAATPTPKGTAAPARKQTKTDSAKPAPRKQPEVKPAGTEEKPTAEVSATEPEAKKQLPKLQLPMVKGHQSKGIVIPYKDETGRETMKFHVGVGERLDEDRVKMAELRIETFTETGGPEMTIDLPSSVLDLSTRVLTGDQGVTIKRSDFDITGKTMEFNTETRQGWIKGEVKMIIRDLTETTGADVAPGSKQEKGS